MSSRILEDQFSSPCPCPRPRPRPRKFKSSKSVPALCNGVSAVVGLVLESQVFDNNTGLAICVRSVSDPKHERWLVQEIRPRPVSSACTKTCSGLQYKLGTMDIGLPRAHDSPQYIVDCCTLVSDVSRQRLRSTSRHQLVGRTYQCRPSLQRAQTRHSP